MIEIRRAADIEELKAMNRLYADVFGDAFSYQGEPPSDGYLGRLLADPGFIALAAWSSGKMVGALSAYELRKFEQERSEVYIYDLAVAEAFRRQGVATSLIETLKPIARSLGAWVIFVQADYVDEPAVALYEKLGTREEVLHFDISV